MLTEAERELITAAVDGELTPDQRTEFERLIAESAAAAVLHQLLSQDSGCLRAIPKQMAPPAALPNVMARVREHTRPAVPARPTVPARRPALMPIGLAASFLLCVGATAFMYFQSDTESPRAAGLTPPAPKTQPSLDSLPNANTVAAIPHDQQPREVPPLPREVGSDAVAATPTPMTNPPTVPQPGNSGTPDALTAPVPDVQPFQSVHLRVPVLLPLADLASDEGKRQVAAELGRDPAFRIDLFATDANRAAESLVAAAKAVNLTVSTDGIANERLKKRLPFAWAVVAETLSPDEAAEWFAAAALYEPEAGVPASRMSGTAHILTAGQSDANDWKALIGFDPSWGGKRAKTDTPAAPKSITDATADQVANNLQRNAAAKVEKHALLMTYLPKEGRINAALSKEVKQFTERRGDRKPNAVTLLIVVRPPNS